MMKTYEAGVCPYCQDINIDYGMVEAEADNTISERNYCIDCKKEFVSLYKFDRSEPI